MAKKNPTLRRQGHGGKRSDRAFVEIEGRRLYLGEWGSEASRQEYRRLLVQLAAGGADDLLPKGEHEPKVVEICARFLRHAKSY